MSSDGAEPRQPTGRTQWVELVSPPARQRRFELFQPQTPPPRPTR